jgi:hypothetical protein
MKKIQKEDGGCGIKAKNAKLHGPAFFDFLLY